MPQIHPTALIDGNISIADDVVIGPHCVLEGDITIGSKTRFIGNCYLTGKLVIGERNIVYPFSCIGFAGQDNNYPHDKFEPGILIGDDNIFREGVTIHRATRDLPTTIGNKNVFMTTTHIGHDCQIGHNTTLATDVTMGGHVHLHDNVIVGGCAGVHQFVSIGKGAMLGGLFFTTLDVPPYFMLTGSNIVGSLNLIGMRRSGMTSEDITKRKEIYKLLYRSGNTIKNSLAQLKEDDDPIALEYVEFIETSRRGIVRPYVQKRSERRGSAIPHDQS